MRTAIILFFLLVSCKDDVVPLPKPRIYPKITYPEKTYTSFKSNECPFEMKIPEYFKFVKDTGQNKEEAKHKCWFDLYCEELNTYMHFSYVDFNSREEFDKLVSDAFEMVDKHNIKASYRDEIRIDNAEKRIHGLLFDIDGPVATPLQFYLTDSTEHFIRGSLYFKSKVNRDSIAPIYNFFKKDIDQMLGSFSWTE